MEEILSDLNKTDLYAQNFLASLTPAVNHATIVGLSGDLGAGKTAFVKLLASALGVKEEILSPTFVIMKLYGILDHPKWNQLVHIDAYRIEDPNEAHALHFEHICADSKNLIVIEWPERLKKNFPDHAQVLRFRFIDETTRAIQKEQ